MVRYEKDQEVFRAHKHILYENYFKKNLSLRELEKRMEKFSLSEIEYFINKYFGKPDRSDALRRSWVYRKQKIVKRLLQMDSEFEKELKEKINKFNAEARQKKQEIKRVTDPLRKEILELGKKKRKAERLIKEIRAYNE